MKKKLEIRAKMYMKYLLSKKSDRYDRYDNAKQRVVVALAADYGNLGDVAITYAQTEYLRKQFPEAEVIDFPISQTFTEMKALKSIVKPSDIITIVGGGNTTDLYDDIEYCRQFVISQFPNNKIISFPQTICFTETEYGKKALNRAIKVYGRHNNLTLSAREEKSYDFYKKHFKNNKVVFTPDIVLSLDESHPKHERTKITLCLREDKEKSIDSEIKNQLISMLGKTEEIVFQDTHVDKSRMPVAVREKELFNIWNDFKASKLVITDRLHGMIFCAITQTPCIAFDNSTKKVSGVHRAWLGKYPFIKVLEDSSLENLLVVIQKIMSEEYYFENTDNSSLFQPLSD